MRVHRGEREPSRLYLGQNHDLPVMHIVAGELIKAFGAYVDGPWMVTYDSDGYADCEIDGVGLIIEYNHSIGVSVVPKTAHPSVLDHQNSNAGLVLDRIEEHFKKNMAHIETT